MEQLRKMSFFILALLFFIAAVPVSAHDPSLGGSKWCYGRDRIVGAIELGASLLPEMRGIKERGHDPAALSADQLKTLTAEVIQPYLSEKLSISVNGEAYPAKVAKVVLEGSLWRIWLTTDKLPLDKAENRVSIEYRLLFEETENSHVNLAYLYQSDGPLGEVQKVFDYSDPVAQHSFESGDRVWRFSIKGAPAAHAKVSEPAAQAGADPSFKAAATFPSPLPTAAGSNPSPPGRGAANAGRGGGVRETGEEAAAVAGMSAPPKIDPETGASLAAGIKGAVASGAPAAADAAAAMAITPDSPVPSVWSKVAQFIALGIKHILIGYDHIAFLVALVAIGLSFREVLKIVTAFTAAHSITLLLAAMEIVRLDARLVEIAIAISICYIAAENVIKKSVDYRWLMTFGFGLIHGFGFASVLQDLVVGKSDLLVSVLSFNAGVELGQVMIFLCLLPVLNLLKKKVEFRKVTWGASAAVFMLGFVWLIERVFELKLLS